MKKVLLGITLLATVIVSLFLYPVISNTYFFVCPGGECRYNLQRIGQFYKVKLGLGPSAEEIAERRRKNAVFFRLKADYTHKDRKTGEIEEINFDLVVVCGMRVPQAADGTLMTQGIQDPEDFMKATADGGAVLIMVPNACRSHMFARDIPDDFMLFVMWFDDVDKMRTGLGYASEDAYESPLSQLKFNGASLSLSNYEKWAAWRQKQLAEFKPIGSIQSPWGTSRDNDVPEDAGPGFVAGNCRGYRRTRMPEDVRVRVRKYWPADMPKFWSQPNSEYEKMNGWLKTDSDIERDRDRKERKLTRIRLNSKYRVLGSQYPPEYGVITRKGGGALFLNKPRQAGEYYPLSGLHQYKNPGLLFAQRVDIRPKLKGFVACGLPILTEGQTVQDFGFEQGEGMYMGNFLLAPKTTNEPRPGRIIVFERDEYVWEPAR